MIGQDLSCLTGYEVDVDQSVFDVLAQGGIEGRITFVVVDDDFFRADGQMVVDPFPDVGVLILGDAAYGEVIHGRIEFWFRVFA